MLFRPSSSAIAAVLALPVLLSSVAAQIPISGAQSGTLPAGVYHTIGTLTIAAGQTWTLSPGVIVKFSGAGDELTVNGRLVCNGTAGNPVIFTGIQDDSAGGDTNGNGPSAAGPTAWRGIVMNGNATPSSLTWTEVRYGGAGYVSNLHLNSASPTLTNCTIRHNFTHGMVCNGNSFPTVANCTFTSNGSDAINGVPAMALPGFTNNTATGNGVNCLRVTIGAVNGALALSPAQMLTGAIVVDTTLTVATGASLTIAAGTNLKFGNAGHELEVNGTLVTNGTAGSPVIFTGIQDDSAGGDTNTNGASAAGPTAWRGIVFTPTSTACSLTYADVRYGGAGYISNLHLNSASPTLTNCTIRDNFTHGMNCNGTSSPTVTNCTFTANGGRAVANLDLAAVPGFTNNTASGNAANFMEVISANVTGAVAIGSESILQGALVLASSINVAASGSLTLRQGVVIKWTNALELNATGTLRVLGTGYEPVVFTAVADDSIAGDTNNNGPSSGGAASWRGVVVNSGAPAGVVEHARIRYTGAGYQPGLSCSSPQVAVRSVRVDSSFSTGIVLAACAGNPANLIVWGCGGNGIHLTGGSFHLQHATVYGGVTGIYREAAWTGAVVNSISYGNNTNFGNFGTGTQVLASNGGFAGSNGNLNVNPQFVAAASGDLHLQVGSPCLGVGDVLAAFVAAEDHDQNSRLLDHALVGLALPDMGAYELGAWTMSVFGEARPGQALFYTLNGPPGDSLWIVGFLDGTLPVTPYGMLLVGAQPGATALLLLPLPVPVGTPMLLPIPNEPGLVGLQVGLQTLTFPVGNLGIGNLTRMHKPIVRP